MSNRSDTYRLFQQAQKLSLNDLEHFAESLLQEIADRKASEQLETLQPSEETGWRQEYRKCGKPNCRCSSTEYRHGPYWYRSIWVDGTAKKEYWRSQTKVSRK